MELCWKLAVKHAGIGANLFISGGKMFQSACLFRSNPHYLFPHLKSNVLWNDFIDV
jgi:hypothetical protein